MYDAPTTRPVLLGMQGITGEPPRQILPDCMALGPYSVSGQIVTGVGRLIGWSLRATTATVVIVRLWDGSGNTGQMVTTFDVSQGFAFTSVPTGSGITITRGVFLEVLQGIPEMTVWWTPAEILTAG